MFGREINDFADYRGETNVTVQLERMSDLRTNSAEATRNIQNAQERQKETQNQQHNIAEELIPIGTEVYVEDKRLGGKLTRPKFFGPNWVISHTKLNTYKLKDKEGKTLSDTFSRERLKLTDKRSNEQQNRRSELVKRSSLNLKIWTIMAFLLFFFIILGVGGQEIRDTLWLCEPLPESNVKHLPFIKLERACDESKTDEPSGSLMAKNAWYLDVQVISKLSHQENGDAYTCSKKEITVSTFVNFVGARQVEKTERSSTRMTIVKWFERRNAKGKRWYAKASLRYLQHQFLNGLQSNKKRI